MKSAPRIATRPTAPLTPASTSRSTLAPAQRSWHCGPAHDPSEQEADRLAQHALAMPATPLYRTAPLPIQPRASTANMAAPDVTHHVGPVLAQAGAALEPALRQDMAQRLGHDFSRVRVHAGTAPAASARALDAKAYTAGQDIVFGAGHYAPHSPAGRQLIAHELVHVMQQTRSGSAAVGHGRPGLIQRQPASATLAPPAATPAAGRRGWKEAWADFRFAQISDVARVPAVAAELLAIVESPGDDVDVLDGAMQLATWFEDHREPASADRVVGRLRERFGSTFEHKKAVPSGGLLSVGSPVMGDPGELIALGQRAARAGAHDRAISFFGAAHEILSIYTLASTEASTHATDDRFTRYRKFKGLYGEMREIYGFYAVLEAEALDHGDAQGAAEARANGQRLRAELHKRYTPTPDADAQTGETSLTRTGSGAPALTFHGANFAETDLTELPGHPFSQDVLAKKEGQDTEKLADVQSSIAAQTDLQAELMREPPIRKKYGGQAIDLNDDATRLAVWRTMYDVYRQRGDGNPLGTLMALIGRYLQAYTHHTGFNVRDFGATSYLDEQMPDDLAGRLVRDCGVYALSVAWDVFQTAKGDPKLKLSFTLATLLDHVVLVIDDKGGGVSYFVNNDRITQRAPGYATPFPRPKGVGRSTDVFMETPDLPAKPIDRDEEIGAQYAMVRDLPFLITPVNQMALGTTADAKGDFKARLWQRYLAATGYMSKLPVDFTMLEKFSLDSMAMDKTIDLQNPDDANAMADFFTAGLPQIGAMLQRVDQLGANAFKAIRPQAPVPANSRNAGVFRFPSQDHLHPVIRIALMLVRVRQLGHPLDARQQRYLDNIERAFKPMMDEHRAAAEAGRF